MSLPPGPDSLESLSKSLKSEVSGIRNDIDSGLTKIRDEIYRSTVERAERHSGYMRNWLALLTFTTTIAFLIFGILGWTRFSDITAERKQMTADAEEVRTLAAGVQEKVKTIDAAINTIQTYEKRIAGLDERMNDANAKIASTGDRISDIEKRSSAVEQRINRTASEASALAQQNHYDLQSSIGSGVFGDLPSIANATIRQPPEQSAIYGSKLGSSEGHIYVEVQHSNWTQVTSVLPTRIELKPSVKSWKDSEITFVLSDSDYQAIKDARAKEESASSVSSLGVNTSVNLSEGLRFSPYLGLIVETSEGKSSISATLLTVTWP
jgi:uncharacterized phage infection (PIP) family protein YhgE